MSYNPGQGPQFPGQVPAGSEPTFYAMSAQPPAPRKKSRLGLWISLIIIVLLLAAGAGAAIFFAGAPARAVNTVVQNYYNAVEQQDYATAYTYLDQQQFMTNAGQQIHLTRAEYVTISRTADLVNGKLTAYTITGVTINGTVAEVTVNVTRGGGGREVDLELQEVNGTWEIDKITQA